MKDTYSYAEAFNIVQIPVLPKKGMPGRGSAYYGRADFRISDSIGSERTE